MRARPRGALFGGAESVKSLSAEIRMSLIAAAKMVKANLAELTEVEFNAIIETEMARHRAHVGPDWYKVYAAFLHERRHYDATRAEALVPKEHGHGLLPRGLQCGHLPLNYGALTAARAIGKVWHTHHRSLRTVLKERCLKCPSLRVVPRYSSLASMVFSLQHPLKASRTVA